MKNIRAHLMNRLLIHLENKKYLYSFIFILLIASFLRIYKLGWFSLWFDEANMFIIPNDLKNILNIWRMSNYSIVLPFYDIFVTSICLRYLSWLGGNEFLLRFNSAVIGIICVGAIYYFAKIIFGKKIGILASFLMAISAFHIYYSQEARFYSFLVLLTLGSAITIKKFFENGRIAYLIGHILLSAIGCLGHFTFIFIIFANNIFFLFYYKKYKHLLLKWIIAQSIIILLISLPTPPSSIFLRIAFLIHNSSLWWWTIPVTLKSVFITLKNFSIGYNATRVVYLLASFSYLFLFSRGVYVTTNQKEVLFLLLSYIFVPIFSVFILSLFKSFYVDRYFIGSLPFFYVIVSLGLASFRRKYILLTLIFFSILSFVALKNYYNNYLPNSFVHHVGIQIKSSTRDVSRFIIRNFRNRDLICHANENTVPQICYYSGPIYKGDYSPFFSKNIIFRITNKRLVLKYEDQRQNISFYRFFFYKIDKGAFYFEPINIKLSEYKRIWLICQPREDISKLLSYLDKNYKIDFIKNFHGLNLYLYELCK